jgi:hypothetical protein
MPVKKLSVPLEKEVNKLSNKVDNLCNEVSNLKVLNSQPISIKQLKEAFNDQETRRHRQYMRTMVTLCVVLLFLLTMIIFFLAE